MVTVGEVSRLAVSLAGGVGGGRMGVQLVSSLVLRLELVCHRRQATIGQQGQAASQKITTTNTFGHQLSNHIYILDSKRT